MDAFREVASPAAAVLGWAACEPTLHSNVHNPLPLKRSVFEVAVCMQDLQLISDNCRKYNAPITQYYKAADIWEAWWKSKFFSETTS